VSDAIATAISKTVAAQLTSASAASKLGGYSFVAKHSNLPRITREQIEKRSPTVTTQPRGDVRQFASRTKRQHDYTIEVCVYLGVTGDDSLSVDECVLIAEKIADFWEVSDTDTGQTRTLTGRDEKLLSPIETQVATGELEQHSVIKCTVILTFRGWR
jgi:hypothetical protein